MEPEQLQAYSAINASNDSEEGCVSGPVPPTEVSTHHRSRGLFVWASFNNEYRKEHNKVYKCYLVLWKVLFITFILFFFVFFTAVCCAVLNNICLFLRCVGVEEVGEKERCRGAREKGTVMIMCSCVREGLFVQHSVTA